eukprot:CAMPEP_0194228902 /NCGR_PEP_ID=MMETSP0156-20130528/43610_1 /TAXON_ID=33649 /ORGANISM="Thalassionema nitzschioides, Strain L26-B" /LENGTH=460 /DNA_ID=CAMNT_0038961425 /DNA_START=352 /DNA_END=1731 /DNA_ORIENTATION=-
MTEKSRALVLLPQQEMSLADIMKPYRRQKEAPIFQGALQQLNNSSNSSGASLPRIRALIFQPPQGRIGFRKLDTYNPNDTLIGKVLYPVISDEFLNILVDGWRHSNYFRLEPPTYVPRNRWGAPQHQRPLLLEREDTIWVVDMRSFLPLREGRTTLDQLVNLINETKTWQEQQNFAMPNLQVVLWDWRDRGAVNFCDQKQHQQAIPSLIKLLFRRDDDGSNLRFVNRCVVVPRKGQRSYFMNPKNIFPCYRPDKTSRVEEKEIPPLLQVPYTVRTDYATAILEEYSKYHHPSNNQSTSATTMTTTSLFPWTTHRPIDVGHFWNISEEKDARLRNEVTSTLLRYINNTSSSNNSIPIIVAQSVSVGKSTGRTGISDTYTKALLTTKIVVVAQRDGYEDHYRFFEAMIGGGMVMTDFMYTLPEGYVDRVNVVIYDNSTHLVQLMEYYLQHSTERLEIAKQGW